MLWHLQVSLLLFAVGTSRACFSIFFLPTSEYFASFISLRADLCTICALTLHAHSNACSLVFSSMSSSMVTTFKISLTIPSSSIPLMNCSVNNLSYSFYQQSAALVLSIPIHSGVDSLLFLCNIWYCSDLTILLCCGINLLHNTVKRPFAVL